MKEQGRSFAQARRRIATVVTYMLAIGSCAAGPAGSTAPIRLVDLKATRAAIDSSDFSGSRVVHIGHKLGAYLKYPHRICEVGVAGGETEPIVLAKSALATNPHLDALEFDAHPGLEKDDLDLYIVHDPLEPGVSKQRYLRQSVTTFLTAFESLPEAKDTRLFIELKAQRRCDGLGLVTAYDEADLAVRWVAILKQFPTLIPRISFTSFSLRALEAIHIGSSCLGSGLRYYLIAGVATWGIGHIACWVGSGDLPRFDSESELLQRDWLTGLWISPTELHYLSWRGIAETVNSINSRRTGTGLEVMISAYRANWSDLAGRLKADGVTGVVGAVHDLCVSADAGPCPETISESDECKYNRY